MNNFNDKCPKCNSTEVNGETDTNASICRDCGFIFATYSEEIDQLDTSVNERE